jgi:hypothetical protein
MDLDKSRKSDTVTFFDESSFTLILRSQHASCTKQLVKMLLIIIKWRKNVSHENVQNGKILNEALKVGNISNDMKVVPNEISVTTCIFTYNSYDLDI